MASRKKTQKASKPEENVLGQVAGLIKQASFKFDKAPCDVTVAEFWAVAETKVPEWQVRKLGGFANIKGIMFPPKFLPQGKTAAKAKKLKINAFPKLEQFKTHGTSIQNLFKLAGLKEDGILRVVVEPDTHVPEHDEVAVNAFCKFLTWYKPHGLVNLGDFQEMAPVAHWPAVDADVRRLVPDLLKGREILSQIGAAAGPQCRYKQFLIGNHEYWLEMYLAQRIPEVLDGLEQLGPDLRLEKLMALEDFGYEVIPLNEILKIGHAHFIHGFYTSSHHAKKHLDVFGCSIYYGHLHDTQAYSAVSVKGLHEAMSLGCLRTLDAKFMKGKPNNWSHSFGIFEFRADGSYTRYAPIMIDGKFSFNSILFNGNS